MEAYITDDTFLKKVFKRQLKRGIAYHCCVMDNLSRPQKVEYVIKRLSEIPILRARILIQYWEEDNKMTRILNRHKINNFGIVRSYKNGQTPGYLNINIVEPKINTLFIKELINRHYGNDFSIKKAIDIIPYVVIDTGGDEIIAFHLYDDRGYYEYFIPKKIKAIKGTLIEPLIESTQAQVMGKDNS